MLWKQEEKGPEEELEGTQRNELKYFRKERAADYAKGLPRIRGDHQTLLSVAFFFCPIKGIQRLQVLSTCGLSPKQCQVLGHTGWEQVASQQAYLDGFSPLLEQRGQ